MGDGTLVICYILTSGGYVLTIIGMATLPNVIARMWRAWSWSRFVRRVKKAEEADWPKARIVRGE